MWSGCAGRRAHSFEFSNWARTAIVGERDKTEWRGCGGGEVADMEEQREGELKRSKKPVESL